MSFKEVKELRLEGKLNEALVIAQQDLDNDSSNIWNKRSIAWVYYDFLKMNSSIENYTEFISYLEKIKSLELPEDEKMIYDTCAFQIGKMLFAIDINDSHNLSKFDEIFEIICNFHFSKPSDGYSFLYKAFHKSYKLWTNYLKFAEWWNFDNFSTKDCLSEEYNGFKKMSIVEQAYIAYSKKLLEGETEIYDGIYSHHKVVKKDKIDKFLPKLDALIESYPDYQYPPYFKAKMLLVPMFVK